MALNLSTAGVEHTENITIYDPLATARNLQLQWKKKSPHVWEVAFLCQEAEQLTFNAQTTPLEVSFDSEEKEETCFTKQPLLEIQWKADVCGFASKISFKDSAVMINGSTFFSHVEQDGIPFGHYTGYKFAHNKSVITQFSNGVEKVIAELALLETD